MARYVVAVSGGIDSVALLHMLHHTTDHELVVAHVDHGIRSDSREDALFVAALAHQYGLPFETVRFELGPSASEEAARDARYAFLHEVARRRDAQLMTAHHADDVIESIAINIHRGTGWRGLATHDASIVRPLLDIHKPQLEAYASQHNLKWKEDSTNRSEQYLRNRIRQHVASLPHDKKRQLLELRNKQREYKRAILDEVKRVVGEGPEYSRYFFTHIPKATALECLRYISKNKLTRPQLERALLMIKTAGHGKNYEAGNGVHLHFTTRNFSVSLIK